MEWLKVKKLNNSACHCESAGLSYTEAQWTVLIGRQFQAASFNLIQPVCFFFVLLWAEPLSVLNVLLPKYLEDIFKIWCVRFIGKKEKLLQNQIHVCLALTVLSAAVKKATFKFVSFQHLLAKS